MISFPLQKKKVSPKTPGRVKLKSLSVTLKDWWPYPLLTPSQLPAFIHTAPFSGMVFPKPFLELGTTSCPRRLILKGAYPQVSSFAPSANIRCGSPVAGVNYTGIHSEGATHRELASQGSRACPLPQPLPLSTPSISGMREGTRARSHHWGLRLCQELVKANRKGLGDPLHCHQDAPPAANSSSLSGCRYCQVTGARRGGGGRR